MALINCPECNKEISDTAEMCPHCGCKPYEIIKASTDSKKLVGEKEEPLTSAKSKKKIVGLTLCCIAVITIVIVVIIFAGKEQNFRDRYPDLDEEYWCEIADDGSWMKIEASNYNYDAIFKIESVNKDLGLSETVYDDMRSTRALDGKQMAENKIVTVMWRFDGSTLEVTYELKNPTKYKKPYVPDVLNYDQCSQFEKRLLENITFDTEDTNISVWAYENNLNIVVDLKNESALRFGIAATELVKALPAILSAYEITDYDLDIYSDMGKKGCISWHTSDLISGTYMDTQSYSAKTLTLAELQSICGYNKVPETTIPEQENSVVSVVIEDSSASDSIPETTTEASELVILTGATVYSRPGTQYYVYGELEFGTSIEIIDYVSGGEWINLMYEGKNAYIESKFYSETGYKTGKIVEPIAE